jgi:hypothetical protein
VSFRQALRGLQNLQKVSGKPYEACKTFKKSPASLTRPAKPSKSLWEALQIAWEIQKVKVDDVSGVFRIPSGREICFV